MKSKKLLIIYNIIITINIILIIYIFLMDYLSSTLSKIFGINIFFLIIVLFLQILNLILIRVGKKKQKKVTFIIMAIMIITIFIPVQKEGSIKYNYPMNYEREKGISMTYTWEYKNLYGLTLKTYKETKDDVNIFY